MDRARYCFPYRCGRFASFLLGENRSFPNMSTKGHESSCAEKVLTSGIHCQAPFVKVSNDNDFDQLCDCKAGWWLGGALSMVVVAPRRWRTVCPVGWLFHTRDFFFFHAQETAWISGLWDCREVSDVFMHSELRQICFWLGLLTLRDCSQSFQGNDVQGQLNLGHNKFPFAGSWSASCQSIRTVIPTFPCNCHICPECGRNLREFCYHFHPFPMFVSVTYLWHAE